LNYKGNLRSIELRDIGFMQTICAKTRCRLCRQVVLESFNDASLLLDTERRYLYTLNSSARDAIKMANGTRSIDQIAQHISEIYAISKAKALQDTIALFTRLSKQKIVESVKPKAKKSQ